MSKIANTRKVFQFQIEIDGFNQFEAQKVTLPEVEVDVVEHGDTNHDAKTPGRYKISDIVLEKLRPLPNSDKQFHDWLMQAQDPNTGGGQLPLNLFKMIIIREMDTTGTAVVNSWVYENCFPRKISQSAFDRRASDNIIETVTLATARGRRI